MKKGEKSVLEDIKSYNNVERIETVEETENCGPRYDIVFNEKVNRNGAKSTVKNFVYQLYEEKGIPSDIVGEKKTHNNVVIRIEIPS